MEAHVPMTILWVLIFVRDAIQDLLEKTVVKKIIVYQIHAKMVESVKIGSIHLFALTVIQDIQEKIAVKVQLKKYDMK